MDKQKKEKWANKDLWNESEFQALCCGLEPDAGRRDTPELNVAIEAIRRAAYVKAIPSLDPPDMTDGDKLYYRARFFVPCQVVAWANKHFPEFPFSHEDIPQVQLNDIGLGQKERDVLLRMIGALALLLAKKFQKYESGKKPNALQIAKDVCILAEETEDVNRYGIQKSNLREKISIGVNLLVPPN